jgi:DNA polymerase-3 subunit gamma/tau
VPASPARSAAPAAGAAAAGVSDWHALVATLGLQGSARHLAQHCVFVERKDGVVRLQLDPAGESFRRGPIEQRVAEALSQHYGEPVRLEIVAAEVPEDILTPARRDALATADRQRAAEQSIDSDPSVRTMREVFGATVKPGSVKPLV